MALHVQACLQDLRGALAADQLDVALIQGRMAVVECCGIRSLATTGDIPTTSDPAFDPFEGMTAGDLEVAAKLLIDRSTTREAIAEWSDRVSVFAAETEYMLGFGPLAELRSPRGMFPLLSTARVFLPVLEALALPIFLPPEWTGPPAPQRNG